MNPDKFHPELKTGRLVRADFHRMNVLGGRFEEIHEEGWVFIPDPMPDLEQILLQARLLLPLHEQATALLGRLDGKFQDTPGGVNINPWLLYQPLRVREARLSSKIENTIASASEIQTAALIPSERSEPLEVRNYMRAIEMGAAYEGAINETMIRALHEELLRDVPGAEKKYPGDYRPNQAMIGDEDTPFSEARFVPSPSSEVPMLMQQLVEYLRNPPEGMPILFAAAIIHYQFESIHPFADGNGRLGRMLITLSLCNNTLLSKPLIYPSGYINKHKQRYYKLLFKVSTHGEWASWIQYFLEVVIAEAQGTIDRINRLLELRQSYYDRVENKSLGKQFFDQIDYLFEQSVVTVSMVHERIGGTKQTARNYIDKMLESGILVLLMKKGQTNYYSAPEIHQIADED